MDCEQELAKKNAHFSLKLCKRKSKFWIENFNNKTKTTTTKTKKKENWLAWL